MNLLFARCGSGLSGECLSDQRHVWIGLDISSSMLGEWCFLYLLLSSWFRRCDALHNNALVLKKLFYLLISFYSHKNRGSFYCAVLLTAWTMLLQESLPVCLSVYPSVHLSVHHKPVLCENVLTLFLLSGSHSLLFFSYQTLWQYSHWDPLNGVSNPGGYENTTKCDVMTHS